MTTRVRYVAEYDYPGMLFPETTTRTVDAPTIEAVIAAAPAEDPETSYFRADGWYAVKVTAVTEKRFVADDGEETWKATSRDKVHAWVIGSKVHVDDIPDDDRHSILRSNIRSNSTDGYGVHTRCGNWQIASDYDTVLAPEAVAA